MRSYSPVLFRATAEIGRIETSANFSSTIKIAPRPAITRSGRKSFLSRIEQRSRNIRFPIPRTREILSIDRSPSYRRSRPESPRLTLRHTQPGIIGGPEVAHLAGPVRSKESTTSVSAASDSSLMMPTRNVRGRADSLSLEREKERGGPVVGPFLFVSVRGEN